MADSSSVYEREREGASGSSFSLIILELRDQGASTVRSYDTSVNLIVVSIRRKEPAQLDQGHRNEAFPHHFFNECATEPAHEQRFTRWRATSPTKNARSGLASSCCIGYEGYPFQYMCSDDKLYPCLFLFIHITSKVFHIALSPRILERISQVANTRSQDRHGYRFRCWSPWRKRQ
jgi:hypothetical protein